MLPLLTLSVEKYFLINQESQYTVGMNGLLGNPSGFKSLEKADVVLMLGTDFPYAEFMPKDNIIVQIDKRAEIIGRRAKEIMVIKVI